jgi:hypothetical protein
MQPGDRVIWLRSPGRSFLTDWRVTQIPAIVVRVCPCRIKIRVLLDSREKTVNVDPDNLIHPQEMENDNKANVSNVRHPNALDVKTINQEPGRDRSSCL